MKPYILGILLLCFPLQHTSSQVVLNADGPGNTYELINSVLANPGGDVIESPGLPAIQDVRKDNHSSFNAPNSSRHIDEIFDNTLGTGKNVFRFVIHVNEDNDRGIILTTDRQRNEIKTYNNSPNNLKGVEGETVVYKWKFKLPVGFQSSSSFTHIHQLKSVDGLYEATPMYTLTTRKGTVSVPEDQLELRYAQTSSQTTLKKTGLNKFKDVWVEVTETIKYGTAGTYSILINEANSGLELFRHPNIGASNAAINWQTGASFVRPKWGIYRSLNSSTDLRNEEVLFADFSIEENPTLSLNDITSESDNISVYPNPASNKITILNKGIKLYNDVQLYDFIGKQIPVMFDNNSIDISNLNSGLYFLSFKENNRIIKTIKILKRIMPLNIVLIEPEIPNNTGNIGRLALASGSNLHLIKPFGFEIDDTRLKRAGLDYWKHISVIYYDSVDDFFKIKKDENMVFLSSHGIKSHWDIPFADNMFLVFGKESVGLPKHIIKKYSNRLFKIPIYSEHVRSLNLANAVSIVTYQGLKHLNSASQ